MSLFGRGKRPHPSNPDCLRHDPCQSLLQLSESELRKSVRLLISRVADDIGHDPVQMPMSAELTCLLVVPGGRGPQGRSVAVVPEHTVQAWVEAWNLSQGELWDQALRNMRDEPINHQMFRGESGDLHSVNGTGWPGAAQAMRFEEILGHTIQYGSLVTFPDNNAFCGVPLQGQQSLNLVPFLMNLTAELGSDERDPMPLSLFWLYQGQVEQIEVQLVGDDAHMRISDRLHAVLAGNGGAG